jgi:hypothetical protein
MHGKEWIRQFEGTENKVFLTHDYEVNKVIASTRTIAIKRVTVSLWTQIKSRTFYTVAKNYFTSNGYIWYWQCSVQTYPMVFSLRTSDESYSDKDDPPVQQSSWGKVVTWHVCHMHVLLPIILFTTSTLASSGDRANEFQSCLGSCKSISCTEADAPASSLSLRLTRWTCEDYCKYECMQTITDKAIVTGENVQQYYGKWPFWRLGGIQEPASVLFSLLNLYGHARGLAQLRTKIPGNHPMKAYYRVWAFVNINAWIWSSIFHTRGMFLSTLMLQLSNQADSHQIHQSQKSWITFLRVSQSCTPSVIPVSACFISMLVRGINDFRPPVVRHLHPSCFHGSVFARFFISSTFHTFTSHLDSTIPTTW